jgi:hypothetical protein
LIKVDEVDEVDIHALEKMMSTCKQGGFVNNIPLRLRLATPAVGLFNHKVHKGIAQGSQDRYVQRFVNLVQSLRAPCG